MNIFDFNTHLSVNSDGHLTIGGIDTVELEGKGFTPFVSVGDTVTAGGKLASVDVDEIIKSGYDPVTVVVLTNEAMISEKTVKYGEMKAGDVVCEYTL